MPIISMAIPKRTTWLAFVNASQVENAIASAAVVRRVRVANSTVSHQTWMAFDSATRPADSTVPLFAIYLPPGGGPATASRLVEYNIDHRFGTGLTWAVSSSHGTLSYNAAATMSVHIEYDSAT